MLSREEKLEMLRDAKSKVRRSQFQKGRDIKPDKASLDDYLSFLDSVQKIFSPFRISIIPTIAKFNKL